MVASNNNTLYLVGGTGGLGMEVAKGLVTAEGFSHHKALVRRTSSDQATALEALGWELVEADFSNPKALETSLAGAKTVVSAFGGNDLVQLETATIQAAKKAGATLYVPSQFGVDTRRWNMSFPFLKGKSQVLQVAEMEGLPTLSVFVGMFSDFIFGFLADPANAKGRIVGDGNAKLSFTRRSDIGYVLAKALADPEFAQGGTLSMEGDNKSWKEGLEILEKVMAKEVEIETIDPQNALQQEQELLKKGLEGDVGAFYASFALHLLGEPARGSAGCNVSAEAKSFGVKLETLEETLQKAYGA